jgi:DnaJ homolog subfamily B member 4
MPSGFAFGGMPGGGGGGGGGTRTFHFSTGPGGSSGFRFSEADDIFKNFAKASGGGGGSGGVLDDDIFSMLNSGLGGTRAFRTSSGFNHSRRAPTPEPSVVEKELPLSLEEIYNGTTKKITTKSKTFDPSGKRNVQEVTLEANIKPGLRAGSKIKYKGVGDQEEGGRQDVHLIVIEVSPLRTVWLVMLANDLIERAPYPQAQR